LINDDNINKFIITMGGKGASHNGVLYTQENDARTIDVSGAGDTFTAALGLAIHNDKSLSEAIIMANKMSYKVVLQRGTSLPL
jgi:sugar/nucleoside kinase (ribokinase family)